jgi:DNA-directed RNA polymerase subunit RPC12/RpoP
MAVDHDLIVGRLALERGYITQEQLRECLDIQRAEAAAKDADRTKGRTAGRPLGVILHSRGYLTDEQLTELLEARQKHIEVLQQLRRIESSELVLGQWLVQMGCCTQLQVNKALEIQRKLAEQGVTPLPRLGEILVEQGFVDAAKVQEALRQQKKSVMVCNGCGARFNIVGVDEGRQYRCRKCGHVLRTVQIPEGLRVDETSHGDEEG